MARAAPYDVIVLDVMLPGMDGFATCRELRDARGLDAGADADRARRDRGPHRRPRHGRRRLPRQAVRLQRAARAPARARPARAGRAPDRAPGRRPPARPGHAPRLARRERARADREGVRAARGVHARGRARRSPASSCSTRPGTSPSRATRTWSTSTSATCARRSTGRSAATRSRRCAASATGSVAADERAADPRPADAAVRARDGGRAGRARRRSSTCGSARPSCSRPTRRCSRRRPRRPLRARHEAARCSTATTRTASASPRCSDRAGAVAESDPGGHAAAARPAQSRAVRGREARCAATASIPGRAGNWRLLAVPAASDGTGCSSLGSSLGVRGRVARPAPARAPGRLAARAPARHARRATCSPARRSDRSRRCGGRRRRSRPRRREAGCPCRAARDEVSRLAETLNDMLERLEAAFEHERRFVADASHELRTPLALLRTELELALRQPRSHEELEQAPAIGRRGDRPADRARRGPAADRALRPGRAAGRARGRSRRASSSPASPADSRPGPRSSGGRSWSSSTTTSCFDGRSPAGRAGARQPGRQRARPRRRDGDAVGSVAAASAVELHVLDEGRGFPAAFAARAFDRFSRADEARPRSGSGLGLAIVDTIARRPRRAARASHPTAARGRLDLAAGRARPAPERSTPPPQSHRRLNERCYPCSASGSRTRNGRTVARRRLDLDLAAVGLDDGGDDREAEPGASARAGARGVGAVEALEDLRLRLGVEPGAGVGDLEHGARRRSARDATCGRRARPACARARSRAGCRRPGAAGRGRRRRRAGCERAASIGRSGSSVRAVSTASATTSSSGTGSRSSGRPSSRRASSSRSSTSTLIRSDSRLMPLIDALEVVRPARGAAREQLGVGAHSGERRAQLVRGVGDEAAELALGGFERAQRGTLGDRGSIWASIALRASPSRPTSVPLVPLDALREVAGGDRGGRPAHRVERPQAEPHDPEAERAIAGEHGRGDERARSGAGGAGCVDAVQRRGEEQERFGRARLDRGADAVAAAAARRRVGEVR